jgi:hypothetical protein
MPDFLKNFYAAHKAKIKSVAVGLGVSVADALISLADSGGHVSFASAFAAGTAAAYLFFKKLYHDERANIAIAMLQEAAKPAQAQASSADGDQEAK